MAAPFTYAIFKPDFTIVLCWTMFNSIVGGLSSASGNTGHTVW